MFYEVLKSLLAFPYGPTFAFLGSQEQLSKCGLDGSIYATVEKVKTLYRPIIFSLVLVSCSYAL